MILFYQVTEPIRIIINQLFQALIPKRQKHTGSDLLTSVAVPSFPLGCAPTLQPSAEEAPAPGAQQSSQAKQMPW